MLTKQCKNVLKNLVILSAGSECELIFLACHTFIARSDDYYLIYDYSAYQKEIHGIIDQLVLDGYAIYTTDQDSFRLTQKALREKQFIFQTVKTIAIREIVIPAVTAVITSIVTTLITLRLSEVLLQ